MRHHHSPIELGPVPLSPRNRGRFAADQDVLLSLFAHEAPRPEGRWRILFGLEEGRRLIPSAGAAPR